MRTWPAVILYAFIQLYAVGQTRPRLDQLPNLQQIRVGAGDSRPGTLVDSRQVNFGRWVCRPTWMSDPAENGLPTICTGHVYGIAVAGGPMRVVRSTLAYTAIGRAALFAKNPEWATWWAAHQVDAGVPVMAPGAQVVIDLLTHPRPLP